MITVHLKTQRGQPYGSERRCCEECGTMLWVVGDGTWTDDPELWNDLPEGHINCRDAAKKPDHAR